MMDSEVNFRLCKIQFWLFRMLLQKVHALVYNFSIILDYDFKLESNSLRDSRILKSSHGTSA